MCLENLTEKKRGTKESQEVRLKVKPALQRSLDYGY